MDTSPSDGAESLDPYKKRFDGLNDTELSMGDTHFYYLEKDCEDVNTHPLVRFLSESGFQSEPSIVDYKEVSLKKDRKIDSRFLKLRTDFNQGHGAMVNQSVRHYKIPSDFNYYVWLSQIQ